MTHRGTYTRRAALGLFALSTVLYSSAPWFGPDGRYRDERKSLAEILTQIFSRTWRQYPFYEDCRGLMDDECLQPIVIDTEALYRAGHSEAYIQDQVCHKISGLIRNDFQESNVRMINGWVLSRIEVAICALAHEANTTRFISPRVG